MNRTKRGILSPGLIIAVLVIATALVMALWPTARSSSAATSSHLATAGTFSTPSGKAGTATLYTLRSAHAGLLEIAVCAVGPGRIGTLTLSPAHGAALAAVSASRGCTSLEATVPAGTTITLSVKSSGPRAALAGTWSLDNASPVTQLSGTFSAQGNKKSVPVTVLSSASRVLVVICTASTKKLSLALDFAPFGQRLPHSVRTNDLGTNRIFSIGGGCEHATFKAAGGLYAISLAASQGAGSWAISATQLLHKTAGGPLPPRLPAVATPMSPGLPAPPPPAAPPPGGPGSASAKTPPSLQLPADITAEATGPSGAPVVYAVTASDVVDGTLTPTCAPASGSTFALGMTTVNCLVIDARGNTTSGSFKVKVQDTTPPTLNLPDNITQEATGPSGAPVTYTAAAHDLVDGEVTPACAPASGSTFPIGATTNTTTTVNCTATDKHGNKASGSFTVTVRDTTPPTLNLPDNITMVGTHHAGESVPYTATASDVVDVTDPVTCTPASDSIFPIGTTKVNCTATDKHGNTAKDSFIVTVTDADLDQPSVPDNITTAATDSKGAFVTWPPQTAGDEGGDAPTPICKSGSLTSGSSFPVGTTTVTCTATDSDDTPSTTTNTFTVTVTDTDLGQPSVPTDIKIGPVSSAGAVVTWTTPTASDEGGQKIMAPCQVPASGSTPALSSGDTFPIGTHTVTCTATDSDDTPSTTTNSFMVTVPDADLGQPSVPTVPTFHTSGTTAVVSWPTQTATDENGETPTVTCQSATGLTSGSAFPVGQTTVTCTATDNDDTPSTTTNTFTVTVANP